MYSCSSADCCIPPTKKFFIGGSVQVDLSTNHFKPIFDDKNHNTPFFIVDARYYLLSALEDEVVVSLWLPCFDPKMRSKLALYFWDPPPHPLSAGLKAILDDNESKMIREEKRTKPENSILCMYLKLTLSNEDDPRLSSTKRTRRRHCHYRQWSSNEFRFGHFREY